ncbi:hypothetical protein FISHEDRAFT_18691, partial [Fistulina hepatica ATCC 64428]
VARVLEIIPDVAPDHVLTLIPNREDKIIPDNIVIEMVLHSLFENVDYPKVDKKRKRVESSDDVETREKARTKVDYLDRNREAEKTIHYSELAMEQLMCDFPYVPKPYIRKIFLDNNSLYAPTHVYIATIEGEESRPYTRKTVPYRSGKGKGKELHDPELEKERQFVIDRAQEPSTSRDAAMAELTNEQEDQACGDGIECGCCFSTYPFDKMIQCPEAHLFCTECMLGYANTKLGEHNVNIVCMDQSGCKQPFPESELRRFLPEKLLALYERVKQRKEIEAAGLDGLEECPSCEYKCVIDNPDEKLFRCENEDCGAVTCRQCKKVDHLPKSCQEMEEDTKLDGQHTVEEAMTEALMRRCPKCNKAFIKESGCNKMTCPNCGTLSCYICRQIVHGYNHFDQRQSGASTSKSKKCVLWDSVEQRHADEVKAAAAKAVQEYAEEHPDVDAKDIKVDLPQAPAPGRPP